MEISPSDSKSTSSRLCKPCEWLASALWQFYSALIPKTHFDAPRRNLTLDLGLIRYRNPQTCHLCAIIVDLRKCVDSLHDQELVHNEHIELSNKYTLSEFSFSIRFRDLNTEIERKFESLRLCSYTCRKSPCPLPISKLTKRLQWMTYSRKIELRGWTQGWIA